MSSIESVRIKQNIHRLLVVAYHYPPHLTPHALRWYYVGEELGRLGCTVDLVSAGMPARFHDPRFANGLNVRVHRTYPGPWFDFTYRLSREPIAPDAGGRPPVPKPLRHRLQKLHAGTLQILNTILVPDAYAEWLPFALARARALLRRHRYDAMITTSEPRVGQIIGWFLKRSEGLPWIADYGDPWVYPIDHSYQPNWKKRLLLRIEQRILRDVDALTVATPGLRSLYLERFPFLGERPVRVIAQGYDAAGMAAARPLQSAGFRLVYCGSLYPRLRDPRALFDAVRRLDAAHFELVIAGRINEFADLVQTLPFRAKIRHLGFIQPRAVPALEKGATVLLHIANASPVQTPGKIYELLGAERPILVITDHPEDEAARLVQSLNRGLVVANRSADIAQALAWCVHQWQTGDLDRQFNLAPVTEGSWRQRGAELQTLLAELKR